MKHFFLLITLIFVELVAVSQTIVSTETQNKKVVLEEYTGIHCSYCPQGHAIAQGIQDDHPEDVFLINIHTGSYATPSEGEPDFRTEYGEALMGQTGLIGFPAGTVNRHLFSGLSQSEGGTAMSRDKWSIAANQVLGEQAYVNVAAEAEIDVQTRELTVHVEAYYTGDSPESVNKLNVVLLQDSTLGTQAGGNMGDEYNHMHRLVEMITDTWGEDITTTKKGSFINKKYSYIIPEAYHDLPAELYHLNIVVFVAQNRQEIINAGACRPVLSNFAFKNDIALNDLTLPEKTCTEELTPVVQIQNLGSVAADTVTFTYSINDEEKQTYQWTGYLEPYQIKKINLDAITYNLLADNIFEISINEDENVSNNSVSGSFDEADEVLNTVYLDLKTDNYGSEVKWQLTDEGGKVLYSGGPYADGTQNQINKTFEISNGCYKFTITDSYGDGVSYEVPGHVYLKDDNDVVLMSFSDGNFGYEAQVPFSSYEEIAVQELNYSDISIFPNPVKDIMYIRFAETTNARVRMFDLVGKELECYNISNEKNFGINTSNYKNGIYLIQIKTDKKSITQKITIQK